MKTKDIISNSRLLLSNDPLAFKEKTSYVQKANSSFKNSFSKIQKVNTELSIFKYVFNWMLRFTPWNQMPQIGEALSSLKTLQTSVSSVKLFQDLTEQTPKQIDAIRGWGKEESIFSSVKWVSTFSRTMLRLSAYGLLSRMPAPLLAAFGTVSSWAGVALSFRALKNSLKAIHEESLDGKHLWKLADAINSAVLSILNIFFKTSLPTEILTLETAGAGMGYVDRNLLQKRELSDKLCAQYLPEKMLARA